MRSLQKALIISTIGLAAACGNKKNDQAAANQDFLLSHPQNGAVVSPAEIGLRDSLNQAAFEHLAPQL